MNTFDSADIISRYTRAQAIEDGVLVDLMQPSTASMVREAGIKFPVAMTVEAFTEAVSPLEGDGDLPSGQDLNGRLWDVLWLLRCAIAGRLGREASISEDGTTVWYAVRVWDGKRHQVVRLKSMYGLDDDLSPCLTIMLPEQD